VTPWTIVSMTSGHTPADDPAQSLTAGAAARIAAALDGAPPVLGIDAGGTGTRAVLMAGGKAARRFSSGPFNYLLYEDGVARMAELIRAAGPAVAGVGVPGIGREPDSVATFSAAVSEASGVPTHAAPDWAIAWLGAFLGSPGIIVMAGTGAVAVGGPWGGLRRMGGHGHIVDDEGSGYWIGKKAVRAALAAVEGLGPPTVLGDALTEAAGTSLDGVVARVQRAPGDRSFLVGLAPLVGACAERDPVARAILTDAAAALTGLVTALRRLFHEELPVAAAGGVFAIAPLWEAFQRSTGARVPLAPPEVGAALLAVRNKSW
jgi:glucosamine kinase